MNLFLLFSSIKFCKSVQQNCSVQSTHDPALTWNVSTIGDTKAYSLENWIWNDDVQDSLSFGPYAPPGECIILMILFITLSPIERKNKCVTRKKLVVCLKMFLYENNFDKMWNFKNIMYLLSVYKKTHFVMHFITLWSRNVYCSLSVISKA